MAAAAVAAAVQSISAAPPVAAVEAPDGIIECRHRASGELSDKVEPKPGASAGLFLPLAIAPVAALPGESQPGP